VTVDDHGPGPAASGRTHFLLKYGELSLKGRNRDQFIRRVVEDIRSRLGGIDCAITGERGRIYLEVPAEEQERVAETLSRTFGLVGFSRTLLVPKDMQRIREAAAALAAELLVSRGARFKVEARRSDKSFPLTSYGIACDLGAFLTERFPALQVDVHDPDWVLHVEIRRQASISGPARAAPGGLQRTGSAPAVRGYRLPGGRLPHGQAGSGD
jgi:thiamine biosynthesis protein ThiI